MERLFDGGVLVMSSEIEEYVEDRPQLWKFILQTFDRHCCGDWSDMEEDEIDMARNALRKGGLITSRYYLPKEVDVDWEDEIFFMTTPERDMTLAEFGSEYGE